ncbi:MAG: hypothetical protein JW748_01380, partial [Anaerolineales bacterium]|nr:hypothetical protein [Anaerolineales bacterium]
RRDGRHAGVLQAGIQVFLLDPGQNRAGVTIFLHAGVTGFLHAGVTRSLHAGMVVMPACSKPASRFSYWTPAKTAPG